jgi:tetratricopeptide (TPR) repeat protein
MARFAQFTRGMAAALPILEQAVQLDPSDFWAHFLYGNAMNGTPGLPNRRQLACAQFEAAIALNPRSSWAYTNLGYSLVEVAIQHLSRAEQLEGQAAEVERAQAEQARARAAAAYERAIELNPRISAALASLANLIRSEDPARAEELYESALAAEPCMWTSLQSYATFLEESGRFEECLVQLQAMMDCDPKRSESHWEVALATSRFGERLSWSDHPRSGEVLEAAASHWRTYLELKPGSEQALVYLQVVDGLLEQVRSQ